MAAQIFLCSPRKFPENWGRWTHVDSYFWNGLVQPPTRWFSNDFTTSNRAFRDLLGFTPQKNKIMLLMLQKSQTTTLGMYKIPNVNNGINHQPQVTFGFLNHQQYWEVRNVSLASFWFIVPEIPEQLLWVDSGVLKATHKKWNLWSWGPKFCLVSEN